MSVYQITVRDLVGANNIYYVQGNDTVEELKQQITNRTEIPIIQQRLIYNSNLLQNNYTLADYNILANSILFLALSIEGGGGSGLLGSTLSTNNKIIFTPNKVDSNIIIQTVQNFLTSHASLFSPTINIQGKAITSISVDNQGYLNISFNDNTTYKSSISLIGATGKGISSTSFNSGILTLTFSDNTTFSTTSLIGATGKGISSTSFNNGILTITFSDNTTFSTTSLIGATGASGRGISSASVNSSGQLVINYTDATSYTSSSLYPLNNPSFTGAVNIANSIAFLPTSTSQTNYIEFYEKGNIINRIGYFSNVNAQIYFTYSNNFRFFNVDNGEVLNLTYNTGIQMYKNLALNNNTISGVYEVNTRHLTITPTDTTLINFKSYLTGNSCMLFNNAGNDFYMTLQNNSYYVEDSNSNKIMMVNKDNIQHNKPLITKSGQILIHTFYTYDTNIPCMAFNNFQNNFYMTLQSNKFIIEQAGWIINVSNSGLQLNKDMDANNNNINNIKALGYYSDRRLKENINIYNNFVDKIDNINVYEYNFINQEEKQIGLIADEIEDVFPHIVIGNKDAVDEDNNFVPQCVDYAKFSVICFGAIKELNERIKYLESLLVK